MTDEKKDEYKKSDDGQTIVSEINAEPDYTGELLDLFRSNIPKEELLAKLDDYHENDMAGAL